MAATVENVVERVKSFSSVVRGVKSGKPDGATTQLVQETIEILATYCDFEEVVPVCLKFLDEVLTAAPQTSTLIRLEGGAKIFPSIIRNFMGVDASILALCAKVMCKCASGSPAMQHHLVKEKGLPTLLLSCCSAHAGEPAVVGPLLEVLVALARYSKGATALSNANLVHACKELLVGLMGHWHAFGMVLKLIKSVMKHEGPCLAALKAGEVVRLLLGVARLVSRMPDQRKLLKRASRTLWVLSQRSLHPLPEMEPNWPAPTKDAAHLNVFAALDADLPRHMELFPEDYACAASQAVLAQQQCALGFKATIVRPVRSPSALPPSVASTSAADAPGVDPFHTYGGTLNADMMMHDLRRVVHPSTVINRLVYLNGPGGSRAAAAAAPQDGGSGGGGGGIGGGGGGADGGSGGSADASTSGSGQGGIPQLSFESCFEGGNLRAAVQVYENEYDLFLATDLNDRSECGNLCQWFYFSVAGMQPGVAYKFNVVNFKKKASLFGNGKQPLVCRGGSVPQPAGAASASSGSGGGASASGGSGGGAGDAACASGGSPADEAHASGGSPADGARASSGGGGGTGGGGRSGWYRAGTNVAYYPSPYRGRTAATASAARSKKGCSGKKGGAAAGSGAAGKKGAGGAGGDTGGSSSASKGGDAAAGGAGTGDKAATAAGLTLSDAGPGLHCCTFTLQFDVGGTYYLASCFPYGYSDLQEFVDGVMTRAVGGQEGGEQAAAAAAGAAAAGAAGVSEPGASGAEQPVIVRSLLCYSLLGQRVDMLTVTDFSAPPEVVRQREVVAITARVHPGETCASWIMQGFIEFLVSSHPTATALRASFVFKLVPMLNPDGVANGSYRCSMSGQDLNRTWDRPLKWVHPTIYHTKKVLQQLAAAGRLALFIDVHGHSTKEDTFFYGCEPSTPGGQGGKAAQTQQSAAAKASPADSGAPLTSNGASSGGPGAWDPSASATAPWPSTAVDGQPPLPQPPSATQQPPAMCASGAGSSAGGGGGGQALNARAAARMRVRMLPYLASRVSPDFSMARSNFKIRKAKLGAGRVVVNRELGVAGSYTLEASLGGQSTERRHFSARDYVLQGHNLARAIAELAEVDDAALLEEMSAAITLPQ